MTFIIILIVLALLFDFLNGMNDAANAIATVVSTHVLSPRFAVIWAAFFNFVAALVFGFAVATTIGKGIVDPAIVTRTLILSTLIGAIIWTHICTQLGLPISVSHALVGGLVGSTLVKAGTAPLIISGINKVVLFIFLSPAIGLVISFIMMILVNWLFRNWPNNRVDRVFRIGQLISSAFYSLGHGSNDAQKTMGIIVVLLFTSNADLPSWMYDKT